MEKVVIIGATSGIGKGLAELYLEKGSIVGITGRRENLLKEVCSVNEERCKYRIADVTDLKTTIQSLEDLCQEIGGVDVLILSAGTGEINQDLNFDLEESVIKTNVLGFTNIVDWAYHQFEKQQKGHLVIISSIAGIRGSGSAPSYNATKAYQINYTEGIRQKMQKLKLPVYITDIRPGFVDTAMAKGEGLFWVCPVDKAVKQIYQAIRKRKKIVYVSRRWRYLAMLFKSLHVGVYSRM